MKIYHSLKLAAVAWTCLGVCVPQITHANSRAPAATLQIPVRKEISDVSLQANGQLHGAIVDANGRPIEDAPVVVGFGGKPVAQLRTDRDGRFVARGLSNGIYQIVSHGGAANYRVWDQGTAPAAAKRGVIHVANPVHARGQSGNPLLAVVGTPALIASIVIAAIIIPIAVDGNDAS